MTTIKLDVDLENNEGTESPWWIIIDPQQNLSKQRDACHNIAHMITGPFFSREDAQNHLDARRYNFGPNAVVYCHTGYYSWKYKQAIKAAKRSING
jgi:hypothetical protein